MSRIISGNFNAEAFWTTPQMATVPSIRDTNTDIVSEGMQELLFAFCACGDCLLTREAFNPELKSYLKTIGFNFNNIAVNCWEEAAPNAALFSIVGNDICVDFALDTQLLLFGAQEEAAEWASAHKIVYRYPPISVIHRVNSKCFSWEVRKALNCDYPTVHIISEKHFEKEAERFFSNGKPYIVKEPMGVSGKGNFVVDDDRLHRYMLRHVKKQAAAGKHIDYLLESYLPKKMDFSCVAEVSETGDIHLLGVQQIAVSNLAYTGTRDLDPSLLNLLEQSNYEETIISSCKIFYEAGYFGFLCFDSMVLEDDTIIPIVEVNARYSMSQIKWALDARLKSDKMKHTMLGQVDVLHPSAFNIEQLLDAPFIFRGESGVVPLSANAVYSQHYQQIKGRLYYYILAQTPQQLRFYEQEIKEWVKNL